MRLSVLPSVLLFTCCLAMAGFSTGCGPKAPPPPPTGQKLIESLKGALNGVAQTGEGGSGLDVLRSDFERLQSENPEKAAAIEKDFKDLLKAGTPDARKKLATQVLEKL